MFEFIVTVLLNAVAVWVGAQFLRGVQVTDFTRALVIGLVVAVLNSTLGQFLDWVTIPLRWLTLGLFSLVVDAVILMIADYFLKGLKIQNFWWAVALAIVVALVNSITQWMFH